MRDSLIRFFAALCASLPFTALTAKPDDPASRPRSLRVLFVGNSYIYTHDLPIVVAAVAAARGVDLVPGMLAEPNLPIQDHLAQRAYGARLAESRFAGPPQLGGLITDPDWRGAVGRAALLDEFARAALDVEGPRCSQAK